MVLLVLILAAPGFVRSTKLIGEPFPGFLTYEGWRSAEQTEWVILAQLRAPDWPINSIPHRHRRVLFADGKPIASATQLYEIAAAKGVGASVRYVLGSADDTDSLSLRVRTFRAWDWLLIFGVAYFNAFALLAIGVLGWNLRPGMRLTRATLAFCLCQSVFSFGGAELLLPGPVTFDAITPMFQLAMLMGSATAVDLVLSFPQTSRSSIPRYVAYIIALVFFGLVRAAEHFDSVELLLRVYAAFYAYYVGVYLICLARLVLPILRARSELVQRRAVVATVGGILGYGPMALATALLATNVTSSVGLAPATVFLFPLSVFYAVAKENLLELDAGLRRVLYHVLRAVVVALAYVGGILAFHLSLRAGVGFETSLVSAAVPLGFLLLLSPIQRHLRSRLDRVFFGTAYDSTAVLAEIGVRLSNALRRDQIAALVQECVDQTIPNESGTRFFAREGDSGALVPYLDAERRPLPPGLVARLEDGRVAVAGDLEDEYPNETDRIGAEVIVPIMHARRLIGAIAIGAKKSSRLFTAGDLQFLRALANQAGIALINASSFEALQGLNETLEKQVRERTEQLIQADKMIALGQLVGGVAHELNNPVSFVHGSLSNLRDYIERIAGALTEYEEIARERSPDVALRMRELRERLRLNYLMEETPELLRISEEGAERIRRIAEDLRTFARPDSGDRTIVDVAHGLQSALRLLDHRIKSLGIELLCDCAPGCPVWANPGLLNQVWLNLLNNAIDAVEGRSDARLSVRLHTYNGNGRAAGGNPNDLLHVSITDNGNGMNDDVLRRAFEPFFTTKPIGKGTGLGLSIAYRAVEDYGGTISLHSVPEEGTTVNVVLPIATSSAKRSSEGARRR